MYADKITESMRKTIDETNRRREKQNTFNKKKGITPQPLMPKKDSDFIQNLNPYKKNTTSYVKKRQAARAAGLLKVAAQRSVWAQKEA